MSCSDALAEWLRRVPAKYMGFPRESSNLSGVATILYFFLKKKKKKTERENWRLIFTPVNDMMRWIR